MSNTNLIRGQHVRVSEPHNHFQANDGNIYQVGSINRVQGLISVQLLHNGRSAGAIPENKLSPAR